ncbi:hypothetical protein CAOG_07516 [Capsaspora owczarzaki ATCC 30864]|nr:hypothetical protein CAOG_07516 [Capsaspora owczarzaki ATCC 30864]|eukprot:XP_004343390.1 hypothetical protein CAOG_07516 [Capsaspora owczarzaki ATCC 30864]
MGINCPACSGPVASGQKEAMGKTWHPKCFVCKKCGKQLANEYKVVSNKAYCNVCVDRTPALLKASRGSSSSAGGQPRQSNASTSSGNRGGSNGGGGGCIIA